MPRPQEKRQKVLDELRQGDPFVCGDPLCGGEYKSRSGLVTHCRDTGHELPTNSLQRSRRGQPPIDPTPGPSQTSTGQTEATRWYGLGRSLVDTNGEAHARLGTDGSLDAEASLRANGSEHIAERTGTHLCALFFQTRVPSPLMVLAGNTRQSERCNFGGKQGSRLGR